MKRTIAAMILLAAGGMFAHAQQPTWDYTGSRGALVWHKLDAANKVCADGHQQSPIDIRGARLNKALQPIEFHYMAGGLTLENNGRTVLAHVHAGSYILFNGTRYDLVEYDFHHPAEHSVKGKLADMEIHLLHRSAEGKTLVLAVRLLENMDQPNAVLSTLWEQLPKKAGDVSKIDTLLNPAGLLPVDRAYWHYTGSLTTPPCTEGVDWIVFAQEVTLSRDQLKTFIRLFKMNTRPVQDTHGRKIEGNE